MNIIQYLYDIVETDRSKHLDFFKKIEIKHFQKAFVENTWSPEIIFRHLLMNINWMLEKLPGEVVEQSNIAVNLDEEITSSIMLEEVINEFNKISPILKGRLYSLTQEQEEEEIDMWKGKMQRRTYLIRLINHEHRHLGQIQWLLKRSTGWTDKEIYS